MVKISPPTDLSWYLEEIKKLLVRKNAKREDTTEQYNNRVREFSDVLSKMNVSLNDFSSKKGLSLFEEFILAPYNDLFRIKEKIVAKRRGGGLSTFIKLYNNFSKKNINNLIVDKLNLKVCPFCNENYIMNRGPKHTSAQLDHFFPKESYPIFAICLFNLVPSCYACNHIKSTQQIYVSPHDQAFSFDNLKISYRPIDDSFINDYHKINVKFIVPDNEIGEKIKGNIKALRLENSYAHHADYVQDILKKGQIYNDSRIVELLTNHPQLFKSKSEIVSLVFSNYIDENDLNKRPLSKLTRDILQEIGILEGVLGSVSNSV